MALGQVYDRANIRNSLGPQYWAPSNEAWAPSNEAVSLMQPLPRFTRLLYKVARDNLTTACQKCVTQNGI